MQGHSRQPDDAGLIGITPAIEESAYTWDIETGRMSWETNAGNVLGAATEAAIATADGYEALIAPEHLTRRRKAMLGAVSSASPRGGAYRVLYKLRPGGPRTGVSLWVEETGHCWPGAGGKPAQARGIVRAIDERYWEEQSRLEAGDHDELTGQLNRVRLIEALDAVIGRAERTRQQCAFLIASVNNLSVINATFGFDVGDEVIAATSRLIKEKLRGGDTIGRYSSNKFGIVLNDCGPASMRTAAERFMTFVREAKIVTSACPLVATISIGGVILPDQATSTGKAISLALNALDHGRQTHQDCFTPYTAGSPEETARQRNAAIADSVMSALDEDRMRFVLQPIVSAATGEPVMYECLLRMERAGGALTSAGEFVSIAEQLGLSRLIDRRTLELAMSLLKKHPGLVLSLNVSGLTAGDAAWTAALKGYAEADPGLMRRLMVEITETAAIQDIDRTSDFVDALRALGCRVAIDDFGAGYTSFKNLKALAVDIVKIDGDFVKDVLANATGQVFIKTMVEIANTFHMETVAEWVGDEETAECMRKAGITYLQGFHYGMPLTPAQLEAKLAS